MKCPWRTVVAVSAWTALFVSGRGASAEETPPKQASASSTSTNLTAGAAPNPAPDQVATDNSAATEGAALAAYEKAMSAYANGDTESAFDAMRESYALSGRPELLYNLARLERERQHCEASLEDYRLYLERVPQGRYRYAAEHASRELADECPVANSEWPRTSSEPAVAAGVTSKRESLPAQSHAVSYWTTPRLVAWSAISAGILSGGAALYFRLAAQAARDDVAKSVALAEMGIGRLDQGRQNAQDRDVALAEGLAVTAGALVTGGVLTLILGDTPRAASRPSALISIQPGTVEASYAFSF